MKLGTERRYSNADYLVRPKKMCRGDTRPCGTDIQGLSQFNELRARSIDAAKKNRYLEANTRGMAALLQACHPSSQFEVPNVPRGTRELVR